MVATKSFETSNSQKLRVFAKRFERPGPPTEGSVPQPAPRNDIFERIDMPNQMERSNPLSAIVDVVPDTRYIFLYIVYNVGKLYPSLEQNARPVLTPSSMVAYCLFLLYGFMLVNDFQGRPTPSYYAAHFMDSEGRKFLYKSLLSAYVPPFMMIIFKGLADTSDPRRPGLEYFCTLAGTIFETDFGRIIPPQIFLFAHNMSTEADTSRNPSLATQALLSWNVFSYGTTNTNIPVGKYFSAGTQDGTWHSWMYSTLYYLFAPVCGKSILRRSNIQEISVNTTRISITQVETAYTWNPYIMFLAAEGALSFNTAKFINEFSAIAKADLKATFQLGAVPDDLNGVAILNHGYTTFSLPTMHNDSFANDKINIEASVDEYSTRLSFLKPSEPTPITTIDYVKDFGSAARSFFLVTPSKVYDPESDPDSEQFIEFDEDRDIYPACLWLLPYEEGDGPITYAMLSGLLIESFEIDGTSVPAPNPSEKLSDNNSQYCQSVIPLNHVVKSLGTIPETMIHAHERATLRAKYQQVSLDLYDLSQNRLGRPTQQVIDAAVPTDIPGFALKHGIRSFEYAYSKISYLLGTEPNIGNRRLPVWSPYRVITDRGNVLPSSVGIGMITNFRAMYGTHVPLYKTLHSSVLIPTS